ncbi:Dps family protein [Larkinella soli]|uniref:Dps family protein n=1 Tax=Larkinella soli TaxID=1770527 RepID=UPI000FFC3679|nr:DNA starvation/stationary phase protection protein [Larkinella soli]
MKATKNQANGTLGATSQSETGNYRNQQADQRVPIEDRARDAVATELQATTVELLELFHDTKQAHWNLRGPLYYQLHEALDGYADTILEFTDQVAERILHAGRPVDGRTDTVARTAELPKFPEGFLSDRQVLDLMSERINEVSTRLTDRIERLDEIEKTSSNLLQEVKYALDKQVWQLRVTQQ